MKENEIYALISLLEDPDSSMQDIVKENLLKEGLSIIPKLEEVWEDTSDEAFQKRIENVIFYIQFRNIKKELYRWINSGGEDILEGAFIIARFQYPDFNTDMVENEIENLYKDVWLEVHEGLTAIEKMNVISKIIYGHHKYSSNTQNLLSPLNFYINQLFDLKRGSSVTLSILYVAVCEKLFLPVRPVNLPYNMILAYEDEGGFEELFEDNILFYVDTFSNGSIVSRKHIDEFLNRMKIEPREEYFVPCSNIDVIKRMINDLIKSYSNQQRKEKIDYLADLLTLFD